MRRSWGSVTRVSRDRYRLRYWRETPQGYRRVSETVRGTRRQAEDVLAMRRCEHASDKPMVTVGQAADRWFWPDAEGRLSANTVATYRSSWKRNVGPRWAHVPLDEVRPMQVQEWLLTMTRGAAKTASAVLSSIMEFPVRYEVIDRNPMRVSYRMPSDMKETDSGVYTLAEVVRLWKAARGTPYEAPFSLMALGSCRVGEALGARCEECEHLEVEGVPVMVVPISRQVTRGAVTDTLKTSPSRRPVVIAGGPALSLRAVAEGSSGWLCGDGCGGILSTTGMDALWDGVCARAGLPRHPQKNLRNSWRTFMSWELGVEYEKLEKMMGHAGQGVSAKHYDKPDAQVFAEAVARAYKAHGLAGSWDDLGRKFQ